ncbi:MAG: winged helix-turn-helix domain-containing protein [Porphyromonadaceae bacterium]|nr:winged helix-turn-helix domain-containing protein [Porphyromonadaceae bacterium]
MTINHKNFQLRDKVIQVFSLLLEKINSTVNRNDILNKVWRDDRFQMNNALDQSVSHIKKNTQGFPSHINNYDIWQWLSDENKR